MKKVLKAIAVAIVILLGLIAAAIKDLQDAEIDRQIAEGILEFLSNF